MTESKTEEPSFNGITRKDLKKNFKNIRRGAIKGFALMFICAFCLSKDGWWVWPSAIISGGLSTLILFFALLCTAIAIVTAIRIDQIEKEAERSAAAHFYIICDDCGGLGVLGDQRSRCDGCTGYGKVRNPEK